jgi:regulatory protein
MQTKDKTPEQALAQLMRLASRAEKSSGDARRLMRGWGIPQADAERILARLVSLKFIDDGRYAAAYVREKVRFSGWGAHKIRAALAAKGVPRKIVDDALREIDTGALEERLEKYLKRKRLTIKTENPYEVRTKLIRYGLSLGYDYDRVFDCVENIMKTEKH